MATTPKRRKIFISYRREDAADAAGRIRDWLVQTKGIARDDVFMDVEAILPGADFVRVIEHAIAQCQAVIVIISPSWIAQVNAPTSYIRLEAETALRRNVPVIPILIGGVQMPSAERLPPGIRQLTRLNARQVRPDSFDYDMDWIRKALGFRVSAGVRWSAAGSVLLLLALSLALLSQVPESAANPVWAFAHPATATGRAAATAALPTATPSATPSATPTERDVFQRLYTSVTTGQTAAVSYSFLSNNGNNARWEQTPYRNKVCSFTPPPYHLQSFEHGNVSFYCYGDPTASFGDFVYTVRTSVVHGDGSIIFFRGGGEFQNFFRFEIHTNGTYAYFIGQTHGGGTSTSINNGHNVANVLGAIAKGTRVGLFVNGTLLAIVPDTVRTTGIIGVGADAYSEEAYVNFTYAQVWRL
jgi:hypothetical protein